MREVRKEKRETEKTRKREKLEKCRNMTDFWEGINKYRKKRKRVGENIEKEDWVRHFTGLLGTEAGNENIESEDEGQGEL